MATRLFKTQRLYHDVNLHKICSRKYGMMELQEKFGENFKKIHELNLETATPLEKKMHAFITRIEKSTTLNDSVIVHANEKVEREEGDKGENAAKPNMAKIVQQAYNWNPYYGRSTKKNSSMQHDHLDVIPDEYKQSGWGMQTAPLTGSPQIHKMFPNTNILKNMMSDGQRVFEMGHLLTNPLKEMGYRDANISEGRDYNVLERVLQPLSSNVVEEWHGSQTIVSQQEKEPFEDDELDPTLTQKQLIMRRLKQRAESAYFENESLPPFKFGFEDIPIFTYQTHHHAPDKLGDAKRTRELKAKSSIFLKFIFPQMNKYQRMACKLIGGRFYDAKTTKLTLRCTNHYFHKENERQIVEWIGRLIVEIERLSECLEQNKQMMNGTMTWEQYKELYNDEWNDEIICKKWNKYRWKQKMLSLPLHMRTNYNLYSGGNRMKKFAKYGDLMYDKAFADASNILQREGPKKGNAMEYFSNYVPNMDEIMTDSCQIDSLPNDPSNYYIQQNNEQNENEQMMINKFNIVKRANYKKRRRSPFGVNSCYLIPSSDAQFDDVSNAFNIPLSQPFSGLRLRRFKLTPWTNSKMMKLYRYEKNRLGMKLVFGDEQFKKQMVKKVQEMEAEQAKQKVKIKQQQLQQGRRRHRKKYAAMAHQEELKQIRRKQHQQKDANKTQDNPMFNYLGTKKIAKQFQSQISDISN